MPTLSIWRDFKRRAVKRTSWAMTMTRQRRQQIGRPRMVGLLCITLAACFLANCGTGTAFAAKTQPSKDLALDRAPAASAADIPVIPTSLPWAEAQNGSGSSKLPIGQDLGQAVPPEPGVSTKPLPDVKMPEWMTRLPPWMAPRTPKVGSPAWKRERVETERQERETRRAINGVCSGC